jgi:hypothetical protein
LCPIFDSNAKGAALCPKGMQQFSGQGSRKSASHIHVYCCSFLAFRFGASFTREEIVVYFFPKIQKLSLLLFPFVFKKKKEL